MRHLLSAAPALVLATTGSAFGATFNLNWLNMAPTPIGSSVPNNSVYNLPGVGNVTISYAFTGSFTDNRGTNATMQNGSVVSGPDTYQWGAHETFGATNLGSTSGTWNITYTFPSLQPAGSIYLGVLGLGATTSFGGGATTATVNQNGTFLGDWSGGNNFGATQFTSGAGTFQMQNSVAGAGGQDPWWNTQLGIVRINDPISSLTVHVSQLSGDGIGLNIASVPAPGATALLGIAGVIAARRRR
jgi:hypothetical protein